jgi:hypothetical protein
MPDPDELTVKANEVYGYMARHPFHENIDLTFIFTLCGLRLGSEEAKSVWERILLRFSIEEEYRKKTSGQSQTNGHLPEQ